MKFVQLRFRQVGELCVAIVKSETDYSACDDCGGICLHSRTDASQSTDVKITLRTDVVDMFIK